MQSKNNYVLIGIFTILFSCITLVIIIWLTVGGDNKSYNQYVVYFRESVSGLNPKAVVKYRGVQIGRVSSIRIDPTDPNQIEVKLEIEQGTPVGTDTIATLSTQGLTGVTSIELSGGNQQPLDRLSKSTSNIPIIKTGPSLVARLDDAFNTVYSNFNELYLKIERLLSDNNQEIILEILRNLRSITKVISDKSGNINQIISNFNLFSNNLNKCSEQLNKTLEDISNTTKLYKNIPNDIINELKTTANTVEKTAKTINKTAYDIDKLANIGNREISKFGKITNQELEVLLVKINNLLTNMQDFTEKINNNPQFLLFGE